MKRFILTALLLALVCSAGIPNIFAPAALTSQTAIMTELQSNVVTAPKVRQVRNQAKPEAALDKRKVQTAISMLLLLGGSTNNP